MNTSLAKCFANVQKSLKGGSVKAGFRHGEKIDHAEKKAPNSDFNWGPLHGEIRLLKLIFFCYFSQFLLKVLAKLNDLESESDIFPQNKVKVGQSELTPVEKALTNCALLAVPN